MHDCDVFTIPLNVPGGSFAKALHVQSKRKNEN